MNALERQYADEIRQFIARRVSALPAPLCSVAVADLVPRVFQVAREIRPLPGASACATLYATAARLVAGCRPRESRDSADLTPDESQVLGLVTAGQTVPEIAKALGWPASLVRWRIRRAWNKIGCRLIPVA